MKRLYLKEFSLIILTALCVNLISCASGSFAVSGSGTVPEDFFGITPERYNLNSRGFGILDEFNAVWIRDTIRWSGVERGEGNWIFDSWDGYIADAEAAGKKIVLVLGFDNPWLYPEKKERRDFTDSELPHFLMYIEKVVTRYKTRVVYEIWNEPNWHFWKGSDENFFRVSAAAAKRIKELVPAAVVLAGSTSRFDKKFTRGMFLAGAMEHTDGFAVHPYGTSPADTMRQVDNLKKVYDEFNYDKPIWITEAGYSTGPVSFCNIKQYPEYIVKTLSGLSARADMVRHIIWYELIDEYNAGEVKNYLDPLNYFGLAFPDGTYKNGAEAFMLTAHYLAGSKYNSELPIRENVSRNVTSLYFIKDDGTGVLIIWNDGLGKKKISLSIAGAENISSHNIVNREVSPMQENTILNVGREPLFITWKAGKPPKLGSK